MIDRYTYNREVSLMAKEIAEQCFNDDSLEIYDLVHEFVDQHHWIIYYKYHPYILDYSENSEALFDQGMQESLTTVDSVKDMLQLCAYWAMVQDILEPADKYYQELVEELEAQEYEV
jgi:hypothetical protein